MNDFCYLLRMHVLGITTTASCPEGWIYSADGDVEQYFRRRVGLRRTEGSTAGDPSMCLLQID